MRTMKLMIWVMMAVMAVGCQATENKGTAAESAASKPTEDAVRQRVEQMKLVEYADHDQILSKGLQEALAHAHSIYNINEDGTYVGFEWAPGILDVCGNREPEVQIDQVKLTDNTHAEAHLRYVDRPCYDIPYTLHLLWEDGAWVIDDVTYSEQEADWDTLRERCVSFYDTMSESYKTESAQDILSNMLSMEPTEESYSDPATIYYNNPKELRHLIDQINNGHQLFKQNPGYTPAMGQQLDQMIGRIRQHLH